MIEERREGEARLWGSVAVASLWLATLETVLAALLFAPRFGDLLWLWIGTAALTPLFTLPVVGVVAALGCSARVRSVTGRLWRSRLRWPLVVIFATASLTASWINATAYVRLYLSIHMLLSAVTLLCAFAAALLVLGSRSQAKPGATPRWVVVAVPLLWGVAAAGVLVEIGASHGLRLLALEQSTLLGHELILLDPVTGILGGTEPLESDAPDELVDMFTPTALPPPQGGATGSHLLLVTIDSLRADRLTVSGAGRAQLPTLEKLAQSGIAFERAFAPSCWTIHSMSSILSARLPSQLDFTHVSVDPSLQFTPQRDDRLIDNPLMRRQVTPVPIEDRHTTLPKMLASAGYWSATVVPYVFFLKGAGVTREFEVVDEEGYREQPIDGAGIAPVAMVDRALTLLDQRPKNRPFFLWLHFMEPHAPYEARDEAARAGDGEMRYDSELRFVDAELGRLITGLETRGLLENTLVVAHADHGQEFRDHGGQYHASSLYDEIVRVPLILRVPSNGALSRPRRVTAPVSLLDLGPTLLDLLGVAVDAEVTGRSFRAALVGEPYRPRPLVSECFRFGREKRSLLLFPYKLIVDRAVGTVELYDVGRDPGERENLADAEAAVAADLLGLLAAIEQRALE